MQLPLPVVMTMEAALVDKVARQARIEQAKQRVLADIKGNRSSLSTEGWNVAKRENYQNHQNAWLEELSRMRAEVQSHSLSGDHTFLQLDLLDALHSYHSAYPAAFGKKGRALSLQLHDELLWLRAATMAFQQALKTHKSSMI